MSRWGNKDIRCDEGERRTPGVRKVPEGHLLFGKAPFGQIGKRATSVRKGKEGTRYKGTWSEQGKRHQFEEGDEGHLV